MRNLEMMAFIVALPMVLGCPSDGGDGSNGDGGSGGTGGTSGTGGNNGGEPSGEGTYQMTPMTGDPYEITKTVLYHNLSKLGDCCFYSFRIAPDPDQQVPDDDPFAQYIDVFYGSEAVGCADELGFGFVYQNVEYTSSQSTPARSPAEPSTEPLASGTYFAENGESGAFELVLDPALSSQLPEVSTCVE